MLVRPILTSANNVAQIKCALKIHFTPDRLHAPNELWSTFTGSWLDGVLQYLEGRSICYPPVSCPCIFTGIPHKFTREYLCHRKNPSITFFKIVAEKNSTILHCVFDHLPKKIVFFAWRHLFRLVERNI